MSEEIELSEQEKKQIEQKRKLEEDIKACSLEISQTLKKYGLSLTTSKPDIVLVPNNNGTN
jgi:hypothetical protein